MRPSRKLINPALVAVGLAPLAVYIYTFGASISSNHARWAEFGSAIGGIYSPVAALTTLAILVRQVRLQHQMNVHEYDQAYLQNARGDIEFYAQKISEAMSEIVSPGQTAKQVLQQNFMRIQQSDLASAILRELAAKIHLAHPPIFDTWPAIYPILMGLSAGKKQMFDLLHVSSVQKIIALISFEMCVALDNLHRIRTEDRSGIKYEFSPLLSSPA
jgi:hypothetical protein